MTKLTMSTEERFDAAFDAIWEAGVNFTPNATVRSLEQATRENLEVEDDEEFAFGYFGEGKGIDIYYSSIGFFGDYLHIQYRPEVEYNCLPCVLDKPVGPHNYERGCLEADFLPWVDKQWEKMDIYFSSTATGEIVAAAFKAQDFDVDWDGTEHSPVTVTIKPIRTMTD